MNSVSSGVSSSSLIRFLIRESISIDPGFRETELIIIILLSHLNKRVFESSFSKTTKLSLHLMKAVRCG